MCTEVCGILDDKGEKKCKDIFERLGSGELTEEQFDGEMKKQYGPDWEERVISALQKKKG